jgi:hypothetical protein
MYEVTIGQDMSCYATIQVPENTPLTREALTEIVNEILENCEWQGEEVLFEEDWSTTRASRIVSIRDEKGNYLVEDMAIDPCPYDAGQVLQSWLRGYGPTLQAVINSAAEARMIDEPVMDVRSGVFETPNGEVIKVEFSVRKGATREEIDLAFFEALALVGSVRVVSGEVCHE